MPDCFIIMPITAPDAMVASYSGGKDHFKHVLKHLFEPAIEKAGFTPIPPIAKGSDLIHAEIIKKLEKADLVLCDMSTLNANVFFELGIRTAVDKPVCMVKDELTTRVPFDTAVVNFHEYASSLSAWEMKQQLADLTDHLKNSADGSGQHNTLWKVFGLSTRAALGEGQVTSADKIELLNLKIDGLARKMDEGRGEFRKAGPPSRIDLVLECARNLGFHVGTAREDGDMLDLLLDAPAPADLSTARQLLDAYAHKLGISLNISWAGYRNPH